MKTITKAEYYQPGAAMSKPRKWRNPRTAQEWQAAVNAASFLRGLHDAKLYGLIKGGPEANIERCDYMLEHGRRRGYHPLPTDKLCEMFLK